MRVLAPLLVLGAAAFLGEMPRRARRLRRDARRRGAELDVDPFAVLGLDAAALAAMDPRSRDAAVRAAYRAAALASHPDTSPTERGDRFALVKRAADALKREDDFERLARAHAAARDDSLAALWRDEVREWSVERLAAHLRDEGAPEPVVAAFVEEERRRPRGRRRAPMGGRRRRPLHLGAPLAGHRGRGRRRANGENPPRPRGPGTRREFRPARRRPGAAGR